MAARRDQEARAGTAGLGGKRGMSAANPQSPTAAEDALEPSPAKNRGDAVATELDAHGPAAAAVKHRAAPGTGAAPRPENGEACDPPTLPEESAPNWYARKRKGEGAPVTQDHGVGVAGRPAAVVERRRPDRKPESETINLGSQRRSPTNQSPTTAEDAPILSLAKNRGNSTTDASAASSGELGAAPGTSAMPGWQERDTIDPPGNAAVDATTKLAEESAPDLSSQRADGDFRDEPRKSATMTITPDFPDQEGEHASTGVENKPLDAATGESKPAEAGVSLVRKGDDVEVFAEVTNMFGCANIERFDCTVAAVRPKTSSGCSVRVEINGEPSLIPSTSARKLECPIEENEQRYYPAAFSVGDVVDVKFQDRQKWYRGRIARVRENGTADVMYYACGDYEENIPTKGKKIRLSRPFDSTGQWLVDASVLVKGADGRFRTGAVCRQSGSDNYDGSPLGVVFPDGSQERVCYTDVVMGAFLSLIREKHTWPGSITGSMADRVRRRRQEKVQQKEINEAMMPTFTVKKEAKPARVNAGQGSGRTRPSCKAAPVEGPDEVDAGWLAGHGPAVARSVLEKRETAKDFSPGLPNILWCALNSPEAESGASFLRDLLDTHNVVPPHPMVKKLMELMKYGPKAEGFSVPFKDPHRTELAMEYVNDLVLASSRLVRQDTSALFGPSSWDDIEVLLSQSTAETENMKLSATRLSQGLHLAARGAKLLSLMLATELQGYNLYSTSSLSFDSELLKAMPTVRLIRSHGVRCGLESAVQHATKCLVRHSRRIMDLPSSTESTLNASDESCALEARMCLDSLGSTICLIAWLLCVDERVQMKDIALIIKDVFLAELDRSLEDVAEMDGHRKETFVRRLKMLFLLSLGEDCCTAMVMNLGHMIGMKNELALVGLVD